MAKNNKDGIHPTRIFKTPDDLKASWMAFRQNLSDQSKEWLKVQYVGKDGERVTDGQKVPMTFEGFKRYCREHHGEVEQYFTNQDGYYTDFIGICSHIKEEIRENQIIGGLLGFYNPSITQRLNGLTDKVDTTLEVKDYKVSLKL
jgi:hypothetical protein